MSETTDRMKVLIDGFDARVAATPASAWDNQSPCEDWKARDVVEHVANNFLGVGGALSGTTHPPVGADEIPAGRLDQGEGGARAAARDG